MNMLQIKAMKVLVHTLGRLSEGVRIACLHGLTSGKMVDYVYRNEPSGKVLVGKLLDRIYLSHRAWQAVRTRKLHLEDLLESVIRRQLDECGDVFILDVASGQAKYLQDTLTKFTDRKVEALCWDLNDEWLEEGQEAASDLGLRSILYDHGDALDPRSFRRLPRRPDIVVASGFYDWIKEDETIRKSLVTIHGALRAGGFFLFTAMTGHADLRMVNELFTGCDGGRLWMKTRPAAAVHAWARRAGFAIERAMSDDWNHHMVTVARKR